MLHVRAGLRALYLNLGLLATLLVSTFFFDQLILGIAYRFESVAGGIGLGAVWIAFSAIWFHLWNSAVAADRELVFWRRWAAGFVSLGNLPAVIIIFGAFSRFLDQVAPTAATFAMGASAIGWARLTGPTLPSGVGVHLKAGRLDWMLIVVIYFLLVALASRFALTLPAAIFGKPIGLRASWVLGRRHCLTLFFIVALPTCPTLAIRGAEIFMHTNQFAFPVGIQLIIFPVHWVTVAWAGAALISLWRTVIAKSGVPGGRPLAIWAPYLALCAALVALLYLSAEWRAHSIAQWKQFKEDHHFGQ